jgi:hypothetical protein
VNSWRTRPWSTSSSVSVPDKCAAPLTESCRTLARMSNADLDDYVRRQSTFYGRDGVAVSSFMLQDELAAGGLSVSRGRITRSLRRLVGENVLQQITPYHFCVANNCSR